MSIRRTAMVLLSASLTVTLSAPAVQAAQTPGGEDGLDAQHSLRAAVTDESFYFVMADRFENGNTANDDGGLGSDPLVSGSTQRRGVLQRRGPQGTTRSNRLHPGLGTTSIWLTPSFKNKAVQLEDGPSAGYHGYWITDFTQIDPHLGTNDDLRALVDAAHARGMKVYFDIITNHTADVIGYEEGARRPYVSKDVEPYRTAAACRSTIGITPTAPTRSRQWTLTVSFPYTPVLDPPEENLKVPAWLNDVTLTTTVATRRSSGRTPGTATSSASTTSSPSIQESSMGMIDIYKAWIADFGVDGFRIDTMKHVNDEFWQQFGPEVLDFARQQGKTEFFVRRGLRHDEELHLALQHPRHDAGGAGLPVPGRGAEVRVPEPAGRPTRDLLRRRRLVHRRRLQRLPVAHVPR